MCVRGGVIVSGPVRPRQSRASRVFRPGPLGESEGAQETLEQERGSTRDWIFSSPHPPPTPHPRSSPRWPRSWVAPAFPHPRGAPLLDARRRAPPSRPRAAHSRERAPARGSPCLFPRPPPRARPPASAPGPPVHARPTSRLGATALPRVGPARGPGPGLAVRLALDLGVGLGPGPAPGPRVPARRASPPLARGVADSPKVAGGHRPWVISGASAPHAPRGKV